LSQFLRLPQTWRARSLYLYLPGTWWPRYTPGHWVPFCCLLRLAGLWPICSHFCSFLLTVEVSLNENINLTSRFTF
jgi:hypothetical protein